MISGILFLSVECLTHFFLLCLHWGFTTVCAGVGRQVLSSYEDGPPVAGSTASAGGSPNVGTAMILVVHQRNANSGDN